MPIIETTAPASTELSELLQALHSVFHVDVDKSVRTPSTSLQSLSNYVVDEFKRNSKPGDLHKVAFYRLRQALRRAGAATTADISNETRISDLMPEEHRKERWAKLSNELDLTLPDLLLPKSLSKALQISGFSGICLILLAMSLERLRFLAGIAAAIWIVVGLATQILRTRNVGNAIPPGCETIGQLVDQLITWKYGYISPKSDKCNSALVFSVMQNLLQYMYDIEPNQVRPETTIQELSNLAEIRCLAD